MNILTAYHPPDFSAATFIDELESSLLAVGGPGHPLCLVGNFNCKCEQWWCGQSDNPEGSLLEHFALEHDLHQTVDGPTYDVEGANPSQLDLMFFNEPQNVKSCSVLSPLSDHCPTIAQLEFSPQRANPTTTYSWDYNRADWPSLRNALAKLDWSPVLSTSNVDVALNSWLSMFSAIVQDYVPRKRIRHTGGKPWYSPFLHRLARCRDRLFRRSRGLDSYHPLTRAF